MAKLKTKDIRKSLKESNESVQKLRQNFVKRIFLTKEDLAYKEKIKRIKKMAE